MMHKKGGGRESGGGLGTTKRALPQVEPVAAANPNRRLSVLPSPGFGGPSLRGRTPSLAPRAYPRPRSGTRTAKERGGWSSGVTH